MSDFKTKFKRQIEILGMVLSGNYEHLEKTADFADFLGVEELTVKRDMQDLRSYGISINSVRNKGLCLTNKISPEKLREIIQQYIAISNSDFNICKSTNLLVNKKKELSLANIVVLQICVEKNHSCLIDYEKEVNEIEKNREINPVLIFQSDIYWRVLAVHSGQVKQYHLNKILKVKETNRSFKPFARTKIEDIFKNSWKSWLGNEKYDVKIKLSKKWAERIKPKQLMDVEIYEELPDGSVIYSVIVNSLNEIASWIVSRGEGAIVLEPVELKERVLELANGVLRNYQ